MMAAPYTATATPPAMPSSPTCSPRWCFGADDTLSSETTVTNTGSRDGFYVPQVYLLQPVSQTTQPVRQLMAFSKVHMDAGKSELKESACQSTSIGTCGSWTANTSLRSRRNVDIWPSGESWDRCEYGDEHYNDMHRMD